MWANCGLTLGTATVLGYTAWMVLCLIYGIQAMMDHGQSNCTNASFKWLWFIVISSALFAWNTFLQAKKGTDFKSFEEFATFIGLKWVLSLSFAVATQYQYIDGCSGKGHHVMFVYMWGNYAMATCIAMCGVCFAREDALARKKEAEVPTTCNV